MGDTDWDTDMGGLLSATSQASLNTAHTIIGNYLHIISFCCSDGCFTYVLQNCGHRSMSAENGTVHFILCGGFFINLKLCVGLVGLAYFIL